jgi:hypothetical protein
MTIKTNLERISEIALFLILLISYSYTFPRWADPNQNSRLDMVVAVVEDGTFQIDPYVENTVDYAKVGEHYYSDKAPGAAFLGIPVYATLRPAFDLPSMEKLTDRLASSPSFQATLREGGSGVLAQKVRFALAQIAIACVVGALPTALLGILLFRAMGKFTSDLRPRAGIVLAYGLLTPAFAYANAFYGHQLAAALLFGAFYLTMGVDHQSTGDRRLSPAVRLGLVSLFLGYSVVTEYPALLAAGILYLYALYRLTGFKAPAFRHRTTWLSIACLTVPAALVAAGWMMYNTTVFGGPLSLGYSYSEQWIAQHYTGFMSLTTPSLAAVWGIMFGAFRGLFVLSPWLLLAFLGFWRWWRSKVYRAELGVALATFLAFFLFNASSIMWWGGFSIGPRYLLPALPFVALASVWALKRAEPADVAAPKRAPEILVAGAWIAALVWSLVATWGLTLAGQAFPSDAIRNPLVEYALPRWLAGDIARNLGAVLGLSGLWSLLPWIAVLILIELVWWAVTSRQLSVNSE